MKVYMYIVNRKMVIGLVIMKNVLSGLASNSTKKFDSNLAASFCIMTQCLLLKWFQYSLRLKFAKMMGRVSLPFIENKN